MVQTSWISFLVLLSFIHLVISEDTNQAPTIKDATASDPSISVDTGNTAWLLTSSALVMIMTPGLGLFYGGLAGEQNIANTILMSMICIAIVTLQWILVGYSFAFGPGNKGFGSFDWGGLDKVGETPSGAYGTGIPHVIFVAFQCMFAQITPAIISGALIGRMKFWPWCIYVFFWTTLVYDPLAHWLWSWTVDLSNTLKPLGWAGTLGSIDFAGGTVIHISSGFAGLAASIVLGKRIRTKATQINGPLVIVGATLLWFGWFGFNAGSAGASNGIAAVAFLNTHIAASVGLMTILVVEHLHKGCATLSGAASGIVVGLVAITPACGYVTPMASIAFGIIPQIIVYFFMENRKFLGFDDTLDCFANHGVGGIVGAFMTGCFANLQINTVEGAFSGRGIILAYQMAAICASAAMGFMGSFVLMWILKLTIGIRVAEHEEVKGLDTAFHIPTPTPSPPISPPLTPSGLRKSLEVKLGNVKFDLEARDFDEIESPPHTNRKGLEMAEIHDDGNQV